jgi:hypothetical protein
MAGTGKKAIRLSSHKVERALYKDVDDLIQDVRKLREKVVSYTEASLDKALDQMSKGLINAHDAASMTNAFTMALARIDAVKTDAIKTVHELFEKQAQADTIEDTGLPERTPEELKRHKEHQHKLEVALVELSKKKAERTAAEKKAVNE